MQLNLLVDNIIWAYGVSVLIVIISFYLYKEKKGGDKASGDDFGAPGSIRRATSSGELDWRVHWRECLQGQWKQVEAENLDNFGLLSNQSKIRRTLGSLAFYRVRHKISFQEVPQSGGPDGVRFCLLRDLGEGMQEWSVEAVIGTSRDTAEVVERRVDTPGHEKLYRYRVWTEEKSASASDSSETQGSERDGDTASAEKGAGGELLMESEPVEVDEDSIKTLQVRSLLSKNRMKMEWHGYNEVSGMSCGMVSYFDRILDKQ